VHKRFPQFFVMSSFLVVTLISGHVNRAVAQTTPTRRQMSFALATSDGKVVKLLPRKSVRVVPRKVVVQAGETIQSLLARNSIHYDGSSLSIVYDLNPTLEDAASIKEGGTIVLPFLVGGTDVRRNRRHGYFVAITVDRDLKHALLRNCDRMKTLGQHLSEQTGDSGNAAIWPAVKEMLDSLEIIKKAVRENIQPLTHDSLSQLRDETDLMIGILKKVVAGEDAAVVYRVYKPAIDNVKKDLSVKVESFTDIKGPNQPPERQRDVRVVVNTVGSDGRPVGTVRIYYIGEALFGSSKYPPKTFTTITNPTEKNINEGDYMIWAGDPANATKLSEPVMINIRKNQVANGRSGTALYVDIAIR
jgi:hypothetical protein